MIDETNLMFARKWEVTMTPEQFERALLDPQAIFDMPERVLTEPSLTKEQKIEILRRWEYNAAEEAVALEEGMPGEESDILQLVLIALGELTGPLDLEHTSPSKQHGVPRAAVKKGR